MVTEENCVGLAVQVQTKSGLKFSKLNAVNKDFVCNSNRLYGQLPVPLFHGVNCLSFLLVVLLYECTLMSV